MNGPAGPSGSAPSASTAGAGGAPDAGTTAGAPARRHRRPPRIVLLVVLVVALVTVAVLVINYLVDVNRFITTDNAQADATQIIFAAPASGTLEDWKGTVGRSVAKDEVVGRIRIQAGFVQPLMPVRAPAAGAIAVDRGVPGSFVTVGSQLAIAYDFAEVFVTARVEETVIGDVRVGQLVDISVDGFPDARLRGQVREIQGAAAGVFIPAPNAGSGDYQKVTQVIPVKIAIEDPMGLPLVPGMNCTVKIQRS